MYFLKSTGVLLLFLGVYFLVLRSETFFRENRFFLLIGMLISLTLPFLVITRYIEIPAIADGLSGTFIDATGDTPIVDSGISWTGILFYTYVAGVVFFFCKFLLELFSLFRLLWKSTFAKRDRHYIYIETNISISPFSFFNYIVYNPELYSSTELEAILKHEQAHSRQLHSIDVFVSKLYCIFFWFNPFAWLHKKFMLQNLEFLADSAAIKQTPSKKEYQLTLLKVSGNTFCPALTNNFYNSLIKKRIVMLQKTQSTQINRWKQAFIIPMLIAFVFMFNTEVIAKEVSASKATNTENTFIENTYGDVLVTIDKNTTVKEIKAIQKMLKSYDITMRYDIKKFNSKNEIVAIKIDLKDKAGAEASATFETSEEKPIPTIKVGKKDGTLIISSDKHIGHSNAFTYEIHKDHDEDHDHDGKKVIVRSKFTNSKDGTTKTWIQKDDVKTINIRKKDGKDIIIINGKEVSPDEIIEEEVEIKKGDGNGGTYIYAYSSDDDDDNDDDEEEVEVKIVKNQGSKIVFNNSNSKEKPLIIVDGKEMSYKKFTKLDADNIATMSVLKGKSAKEKYGKKGKNGVIIIETKKKK